MLHTIVCTALLLTGLSAYAAPKIDKKDSINGVDLSSGKDDSTRVYTGAAHKTYNFPLQFVKAGVLNFEDKCNNTYKEKREYTDKNKDCKYHNENVVESFVVRTLKPGWTKEPGEVDRYVIGRRIYNRGSFGFYELVKVIESKNPQGQKQFIVTQEMLSDDEVKQYTDPKFDRDSAFDDSLSTFVLTELAPNQTKFDYEYTAETKHWLLNKEVTVPQVFASISKSISDLLKTIDEESATQSRELAAKK